MATHEHDYEPLIEYCFGCNGLQFSRSLAAAQAAYEATLDPAPPIETKKRHPGNPAIRERNELWASMNEDGMSVRTVADKEGVPYQRVYEGITAVRGAIHRESHHKGKKFTYTRKDAERWAQMNKTMTMVEIAAAEDYKPWVIRSGIKDRLHRKIVDHRRSRAAMTTEEARVKYAEAIALYEGGMSQNQIATKFGVSRERVRQWFVKAGLGNIASERRTEHRVAAEARRAEEATKPHVCSRCGEEYMPGDGHTDAGAHVGQKWGTGWASRYWDGVAEDYTAGMKMKDIAEKWHVTPGQIMRSVKAHGLPHRRPSIKRTGTMDVIRARKARIRRLNEQGFTNPEIAEVVSCSVAWVRLVLKEAGLASNVTPHSQRRQSKRKRTSQGTFAAAS